MLAAALTGAVVSCSAEADPQTAPTALSAPTSAPTSTPTTEATDNPKAPIEPVLPAGAEADSRAGAEAFVRYYIELLNYASQTGDIRLLASLGRDCVGCHKYERLFHKTYAEGGSFVGNLWSPFGFTAVPRPGGYFVLTQVRAAAGKFTARGGAEVQLLKRDEYALRFTLDRSHRSWLVSEFEGR